MGDYQSKVKGQNLTEEKAQTEMAVKREKGRNYL
jgi:hypothetical protein